jgi:hypothetical protein
VSILPDLLPIQTFFGSDKTVDLEILNQTLASLKPNQADKTIKQASVEQSYENEATNDAAALGRRWLQTVWNFVVSLCPDPTKNSKDGPASEVDFSKEVASFIAPLANWCLLPVQFSGRKYWFL